MIIPAPGPTDLLAAARDWARHDPDPANREQVRLVLAAAEAGQQQALEELADAFGHQLVFGTAGLRAAMGPGPARMNRVTVGRAAAGLAGWLTDGGLAGWLGDGGPGGGPGEPSGLVLIGHDARHHSARFARDSAEIIAATGLRVLLIDRPVPTPVLAFGIRRLGALAALMVTASHNPATDNGCKVYLGDGCQIIAPVDTQIAERIARLQSTHFAELPRSAAVGSIGTELLDAYCERTTALLGGRDPREVSWVYSAMHGVGADLMEAVARANGLPAPVQVARQRDPDPDFPSVPFPNPEEPGAMDLAIDLAARVGADVAVVNDPDADRCALAAPLDGRWRRLSGDELGVLLGEDAIRRRQPGTLACSIVSATMLGRIAAGRERHFVTTLTGFKWIGRVPGLAFGYEEAIGYCCDQSMVADKDGITAALVALRLVAELKAEGLTLADRLDELDREWGVHATDQLAVRVRRPEQIAAMMSGLRGRPPEVLAGRPLLVRDLAVDTRGLPATDAVELSGADLRVVVRPSGTEPKLKCYLEARSTPSSAATDLAAARAGCTALLGQLRTELSALLGLDG